MLLQLLGYFINDSDSRRLWDLHPAGRDCTHFCFSPGLVEAILGEVIEAVDAAVAGRSVELY